MGKKDTWREVETFKKSLGCRFRDGLSLVREGTEEVMDDPKDSDLYNLMDGGTIYLGRDTEM